jgi:hypothetical protein
VGISLFVGLYSIVTSIASMDRLYWYVWWGYRNNKHTLLG